MCQPQSQGGKRCLRHSAASNAEVRFSWAKTGVDRETIYGILKDLNKEGRKLEAPQLEEVKEFLRKEEFKTKLDPDLNERDRKLILKNLKKAEEEAEKQGVTGGAFHAWKNLFSKTVERVKKPLVALGLAGTLALTACTGQGGVTPASPSPSETNNPVVACSTENPGPYGDVIAKEEVKDQFGEYCHTTIDPKSAALKWDESKVDVQSLKDNGFTVEDAKKAQKTVVTFLAEQGLDSSRLDNYKQSNTDWVKANSSLLSNPESYLESAKKADGLSSTGLLVTDYLPEPTVRNGGPRATSTNIQVNRIYGTKATSGVKIIVVETGANSLYDVKNTTVVDTYLKNNPGTTKEQLQAEHPDMFDANTPVNLIVQGTFTYSVKKDSLDKIAGSRASWSLGTQTGTQIVK